MDGFGDSGRSGGRAMWGAVIFFFILIVGNALGTLLGWSGYASVQEKRPQTSFPQPTVKEVWEGSFGSSLAAWSADRHALRKPLALWLNTLAYRLLDSTASATIVIGRQGWIFGWQESGQGAARARALEVGPDRLLAFQAALEKAGKRLQTEGVQLVLMVVPAKATVYGRYLPPFHRRTETVMPGERLVRSLGDQGPCLGVDIYDVFRSRSWEDPLFFKADLHWTHRGAMLAADTFFQVVRTRLPDTGIGKLPPMAFFRERLGQPSYFKQMGVLLSEEEWMPRPSSGWSGMWKAPAPNWFPQLPRSRVQYRVNPRAGGGKVLVVGDSFGRYFLPYLAEGFSEALLINPISGARKTWSLPRDAFETYRPQVLVLLFFERRLVEWAQQGPLAPFSEDFFSQWR